MTFLFALQLALVAAPAHDAQAAQGARPVADHVLPAMQAGVVTHARAVVFHAKPAVALQPQLDCPVKLSET